MRCSILIILIYIVIVMLSFYLFFYLISSIKLFHLLYIYLLSFYCIFFYSSPSQRFSDRRFFFNATPNFVATERLNKLETQLMTIWQLKDDHLPLSLSLSLSLSLCVVWMSEWGSGRADEQMKKVNWMAARSPPNNVN